ncbi:hypothetical protein J2Z76_002382 [Sedimentibacter acidaminivorans]|uniref:DUF5673 domain-containing protein n=1 Tax=Sedimentibacter acidaminivorans TaxID=913099 RepID=A0ABS4GFN9_9FIRM|nr:DUF5673 domain-containing protein [Sedimentibacter acidaminivorans]MBP1926513.1 hypothetical protein [Sedimentibacter acidaminivorans]
MRFNIVLIVFVTILILYEVQSLTRSGELIAKEKNIFYILQVVTWGIFFVAFGLHLKRNIIRNYNNDMSVGNILSNVIWMSLSIVYIIRGLKGSAIRENGIFVFGTFHKWSKIQSYSWVSPNIIQFKFKASKLFKRCKPVAKVNIILKEEAVSEVEKIVQEYFPS